jgi:hypothetical protein
MKGFVLVAVIGSMRRALAVVVVLVALPAAIYVGSHKLSNPDNYHALRSEGGPGCVYTRQRVPPTLSPFGPTCSRPTRAAWQIPLAVLLAAVALGAVLAGTDEYPGRRSQPSLSV